MTFFDLMRRARTLGAIGALEQEIRTRTSNTESSAAEALDRCGTIGLISSAKSPNVALAMPI